MKADFSRTTFKPQNHYSGVRLQQGRVQLDAEFNEHVDIEAHRDESLTLDVVGANAVPVEGGGFEIGVGSNLRDVDVAGNETWAIGEDGTVLKAAPGTQPWALQPVPPGAGHLNALHLLGAGRGWMVGEGAKTYELSGTQPGVWEQRNAPAATTADLYDVHVDAVGANVWAVGAGGTILFWDGTQWLDGRVQGVTATLRGIHFSGATGWIVGDGGTLLQATDADGPWLAHTASKISTNLRAVALPSATTGWAVGDGGAIYAWDNENSIWKRQTTPAGVAATLRDVAFLPNSTQGTIVGDDGTILTTTDGVAWSRETPPTTAHLRGVDVESGSVTLAVGENVALASTSGGWARTAQSLPSTARNVTISPGDMYVSGFRIENDRAVTYTAQPDRREPLPTLGNASQRQYGFYLEAQQQLLTALERESLREVALGGPDTATRTRAVWQVKAIQLQGGTDCAALEQLLAAETGKRGHARLRARAEPAPLTTGECLVSPNGGYRRLENQLYRVEIHLGTDDPAGATFKWSRENGSVTAKLEAITRSTTEPAKGSVTVSSVGRDDVLGFAPEHLIEVTDETRSLAGEPGLLLEITKVTENVLEVKGFTGAAQPSMAMFPVNPIVRRWEGRDAVTAGAWIDLEDGVQVQFAFVGPAGEAFRTGDYWMIPARTSTSTVEWPHNGGVSLFEPSRGAWARLAALGVLRLDANGWTVLHDCRRKFPPLSAMMRMEYVGGDGQEAMPDLTAATTAQGPFYPLPKPLEVAVTNGRVAVGGARVRFARGANELGQLTAVDAKGQMVTGASVETVTDRQTGIASASWSVDGNNLSQVVTATLVDYLDQAPPNPIHFNANLSVAAQVAYQPSAACLGLKGATTVQAALDTLARTVRLEVVAGDAQEVAPADAGSLRPLAVRVVNDCGPVNGATVRFIATGGGSVDGNAPSGGISTANVQTTAVTIGADGLARDGIAVCDWKLDPATPVQHVLATITGVPSTAVLPTQSAAHEFIARIQSSFEPGIRIQRVMIAPSPPKALRNDHDVSVKDIIRGIEVHCSAQVSDVAVDRKQTPHPTCFVTIDLPYPLTASDRSLWNRGTAVAPPLGYQPLVLAATVTLSADKKIVVWKPTRESKAWIGKLLPAVKKVGLERVLARLTLKGNFIWMNDGDQFLDGDSFADPSRSTASAVELDLPSGDRRRGGTFEMWFWLATRSR